MNRKLVIVGRSSSGKDSMATCLKEQFGMEMLLSTTTRPPRYTGEDTHIFISEEEANQITERVAETVINGYQYFATRGQFEDCDIYIIDPVGLDELCKRAPDIDKCVVYVNASKNTRKKRAIARAEDPKEAERVFDLRHSDEGPMFTEFERLVYADDLTEFHKRYPSVSVVITVENERCDKAAMDHKAELVNMYNDQMDLGDVFGVYLHRI